MSTDTDVLVVGSGPVGLTLAVELLRRGTSVRVIERVSARERESKGIWVMPRTLEIFDALGIAERLLGRGHRLVGNDIYTAGRRIASVGYGRIGPTRFRFALVVPQWEVEDALNEAIVLLGGSVEPDHDLLAVDQDADGVTATLRISGRTETVRTGWLVGCDGRTSTIRDLLGVRFDAEPYATTLLLADAVLVGDLARDRSHTFQGPQGAFIAVPLPDGLTRAVVYGPPTEGRVEPTLDGIHELMHRHGPSTLSLSDPTWLSAFRIQRSMADRLRVGRCLLAGDAAHVHSPFGGQGMNTGIQDATNLAWKLSATASGLADPDILDSYEHERHGVAERVLADTHRQTKAFLDVSGPRAVVRDTVVRGLGAAGVLDRRIGTSLSGYFDTYRDSPLTHRADRGPAPRPGDRMPDVAVQPSAGPGGTTRSLHAHLATHTSTLVLVVDRRSAKDMAALDSLAARALRVGATVRVVAPDPDVLAGTYPSLAASPRIVDPGDRVAGVLGARRGAALLVRPDGYLVCRAKPRQSAHLLDHLAMPAGAGQAGQLETADRR